MSLTDVKVGDTVYDPGHRGYDNRRQVKPRILYVHKVARQYLYASPNPTETNLKSYSVEKLDRETGSSNDWNGIKVYRSEEAYKEKLYREELCAKIKSVFGQTYGVTVPDITTDQLKEIAKTLGVEL